MAKRSTVEQAWEDALRPACRARGMRFVRGSGFTLDDIYLTELCYPRAFHPGKDPDRLRVIWTVDIKPLAVDEILWNAFLPDVSMGPQMRINRRVNGAFRVQPLRIEAGSLDVLASDEPNWEPVLDAFDRARTEFITAYPTVADYVSALEQRSDGIAPNRALTRTVTALIAAGRGDEAARVADEAIARGEGGGMSSEVDVLKYLSAWAKGPQAYYDFRVSLKPTHDYSAMYETKRSDVSVDLSREHHRGMMAHHLHDMDGSGPWAIVLSARPPDGVLPDFSTSRYLQAAGSADAMTIEYCAPGGAEIGAVSVRSVVGRPHGGPADRDVEIVLPRSVETISRHEVFTAQEAAEMFERFYRSDTIGDDYVLRPVEGYRADGGLIDLRQPPHRQTR
jgi:hypothetical protein